MKTELYCTQGMCQVACWFIVRNGMWGFFNTDLELQTSFLLNTPTNHKPYTRTSNQSEGNVGVFICMVLSCI